MPVPTSLPPQPVSGHRAQKRWLISKKEKEKATPARHPSPSHWLHTTPLVRYPDTRRPECFFNTQLPRRETLLNRLAPFARVLLPSPGLTRTAQPHSGGENSRAGARERMNFPILLRGTLTDVERLTMRDTNHRAAPLLLISAALYLFVLHASAGEANDWPSFRGVRAAGVADGTNPPVEWDVEQGSHIAWKTPVSGMAHSSPIIRGERVYLTTAISARADTAFQFPFDGEMDRRTDLSEHQFRLLALDLKTGSVVWDELALEAEPRIARHPHSSYAAPTPATDGEYLVAFFGSEGLYTFDLSGKLLWKRDLGPLDQGSFDVPDYTWGYASSPIIYKNLAIVQCDQQQGSFIAAFDLAMRASARKSGAPSVTRFRRGLHPESTKARAAPSSSPTAPSTFAVTTRSLAKSCGGSRALP